jgi:hypothetical protein
MIIGSSSFPINGTQHTITAAIRGHFWCPKARNQEWCISMSTASLLSYPKKLKTKIKLPTLWFSQDVLKTLDLKSLAQIEKFWVPISLKDVIVALKWLLFLMNQILTICIKPYTQLDAGI